MAKQKNNRPDHVGSERGIFAHNKSLLRKTATICALCGLPLDKTLRYPDPMSISIDHIIPVAIGGNSNIDNLQATHLICNKQKGTKLIALKGVGSLENQKNNNNSFNCDGLDLKIKKEVAQIPQYVDWRKYSDE